MGVFKEEANAFETIARESTQIFSDAADHGFPYNTQDLPVKIIAVMDAINEMKSLDAKYPGEKNLVRNRLTWGDHDNKSPDGVSLDIILFWERDAGRDIGTKYRISFSKTGNTFSKLQKEYNAFISVEVQPYSERT